MINRKQYLYSSIVALGLVSAFALPAQAAGTYLAPEVVSSTYEENGEECASVTINGEEIIS